MAHRRARLHDHRRLVQLQGHVQPEAVAIPGLVVVAALRV
jgi:hypothetical protein